MKHVKWLRTKIKRAMHLSTKLFFYVAVLFVLFCACFYFFADVFVLSSLKRDSEDFRYMTGKVDVLKKKWGQQQKHALSKECRTLMIFRLDPHYLFRPKRSLRRYPLDIFFEIMYMHEMYRRPQSSEKVPYPISESGVRWVLVDELFNEYRSTFRKEISNYSLKKFMLGVYIDKHLSTKQIIDLSSRGFTFEVGKKYTQGARAGAKQLLGKELEAMSTYECAYVFGYAFFSPSEKKKRLQKSFELLKWLYLRSEISKRKHDMSRKRLLELWRRK